MLDGRGGEFVDPLGDRAADPAPVIVAGRRQRGGRDVPGKVVDGRDLGRVPAGGSGRLVDDGAASADERRGAPSLATSSNSPPAPMPSTTRPPDSADRAVTVRASMGAGRLGRLVTLTAPVMLRV
jgi:hypothetical protein